MSWFGLIANHEIYSVQVTNSKKKKLTILMRAKSLEEAIKFVLFELNDGRIKADWVMATANLVRHVRIEIQPNTLSIPDEIDPTKTRIDDQY